MPTEMKLDDLFLMTLQDIYYGEKQIEKALPKMIEKASNTKLQKALIKHHKETEEHIERLENVFSILGKPPKGEKCEAIGGLIKEGEEVMKKMKAAEVRDAGMLAAGQAIEHYEIARYGALSAWANQMGMSEVAELLEATLEEEKNADRVLNEIALSSVNAEAA